MSKSLRSPAQTLLLAHLRQARDAAGLTQTELAELIGRPQSYVAKIEGGERRIDVVEFVTLMKAVKADPAEVIHAVASKVSLQGAKPPGRVKRTRNRS